jgi:hypothetical protein
LAPVKELLSIFAISALMTSTILSRLVGPMHPKQVAVMIEA